MSGNTTPPSPIEAEAHRFAESYAALFASPDCSDASKIPHVSASISKFYRPGVTFFTNGDISRFETQDQAASLIAKEMLQNTTTGLGTCLLLRGVRVVPYSEGAATCYLTWTFRPAEGSRYEGNGWTFENIYGYRAASCGREAGWEYVVRDREVLEMRKVTGEDFL